MSGSLSMRLHPERVPDERLPVVWEAVYEGYTECWDQDALEDMAAVGEEVCSVLEELVNLRTNVAELVKAARSLVDVFRINCESLSPEEAQLVEFLAETLKPFEGS